MWHVLYRSSMAYQLEARKPDEAFPVLTRQGFAAPSLITARADLEDIGLVVTFALRVASGGTHHVMSLDVRPRGMGNQPAITARALRAIRLDQLAREAVTQLERPVVMRPDHAYGAFQIIDDPDRIWASHGHLRDITNPEDLIWVSRPVPGHQRTPREQAEIAAQLYTQAVADGSRAPTQAVADQLGYSRSQASRMIRTARDLGLLGNAVSTAPEQPQALPVKPEPGPSIFLDPSKPRPWERPVD